MVSRSEAGPGARSSLRDRARTGHARVRAGASSPGTPPPPSLVGAPLGQVEADELAAVLSALADPVRLRIVSLLLEKGETSSCELAEPLGRSQPTISHHTGILAAAGLIAGERRGRWMWWRVDEQRLAAVRGALGA